MKTLALLGLFGSLFVGIASLPTAAAACGTNVASTCDNGNCDYNIASNCAHGGADCWINVDSECRDGSTCTYNVASDCWLGGTCTYNLVEGNCHDGGSCEVNIASECTGDCDMNVLGSTCSLALELDCLFQLDAECVADETTSATAGPVAWLPVSVTPPSLPSLP